MRRAATARPKRSQRLVPRVHRIVDVGRWTILLRFTGHFSKFDNHCYLLTVEIGPDLAAHFHRSRSIARNQETGYAAKPHTPSAYSSLNPGFIALSMSGGGLSCFVSLVTFPSSIIIAISLLLKSAPIWRPIFIAHVQSHVIRKRGMRQSRTPQAPTAA